jgi:transposase-like protein
MPIMPRKFDPDACQAILDAVAIGRSVRDICRQLNIPDSTFRTWVSDASSNPNRDDIPSDLPARYARARIAGADAIAEEILEIVDDSTQDVELDVDGNPCNMTARVQRSKLRADARRWLLSKMHPSKYGDRIEQVHTSPDGGPPSWRVEIVTSGLPGAKAQAAVPAASAVLDAEVELADD